VVASADGRSESLTCFSLLRGAACFAGRPRRGADYFAGMAPGSVPLTIGTRTALPHSVHEPS
jgi:hypothetical protein